MKKFLLVIILFSFIAFPSWACAASYYVAQVPAGKGNGTTYANRMSVSDHNTASFSPGDTIYLSGTITSKIVVPSSGSAKGGYITYDGYEAGDYVAFSEATGKVAKVSRSQKTGYTAISSGGKNYIIIQDIEIEECGLGMFIADGNHITVRRVFIHDTLSGGITFTGVETVTVGGSSGSGVVVKDAGNNTAHEDIAIVASNDITLSYNKLYATKSAGASTDRGIDGILTSSGAYDILIEYNEIFDHKDAYGSDAKGEDGIDLKKATHDVIIRYNTIYGNRAAGIIVNSQSHHIDIYDNLIYDNGDAGSASWPGILIQRGGHDVNIWSNKIRGNEGYGISVQNRDSFDDSYNVYIHDNLIAENAKGSTNEYVCGIGITQGHTIVIKNNTFYKNHNAYYRQIWVLPTTSTTLEHNTYYWPDQTSLIRWGNTDYTVAKAQKLLNIEDDPPVGADKKIGIVELSPPMNLKIVK